jgi:hypothetical protein
MNTSTPQDPLAALKKSSPGDPIIPALEHINIHLDTMKSHAKSIARDATSLRNTRKMIFFIACLVSAGVGSAGTWYAMHRIPPPPPPPMPEAEILRRAGITLYITSKIDGTGLQIIGRKGDVARATTPQESNQPGYLFIWRNQ